MREDLFCCLLSKLAYYSRPVIAEIFTCRPYTKENRELATCTSTPKVHESDIDAECFTVERNNKLYIAFRGTESIRDCLSDANIIRVPMDLPEIADEHRPNVHWGFLRQFRSLQKEIDVDIADYLLAEEYNKSEGLKENDKETSNKKELVITGHSLGAAQATLASLQFKLSYPQAKVSCYTFGSPRVGDEAFVSLFENHVDYYERVVNEEDPVTLVPFSWRFSHLPKLAYLDAMGELQENITENRWLSFFKDLWDYFVNGNENPFGDHSCEDYLCKLESINGAEENQELIEVK